MRFFLRTLAITICVAMSFANAQAQVITADRAQEIANSFFSSGMKKSPAARSTAVSLNKSADSRILSSESSSEAPTFHILTPASGEGFVIVAGEEMENPIIGYSFEGTIDTNELPVGFVDYMTDIDAQVKALRKYNAENPQKAAAARSAMQRTNYAATTMGDKVYLETASWGQGNPFNTQCFTSYNGSTNALTGCVPTAYAIIMRYHEWPLIGTGTLYNCQAPTYVEITDRTYDYSKMPLVYDGNWSTEQINEVAKLMSHLGHSFMVTYGSSQTAVSDPSNTDKPNKHFNYDLVYASYQANFTMDSWEEKIKESIDNGCPIPYASDNAGTGDTRHMFVLDGYTANDYFHFNFGWNGNGNGWFKLDAITPSQGDNYSWQDGADHYAIFNFTPNKTKYAVNASVSPANAGTVSINGGAATGEYLEGATVTLAATANTGYTFSNWTKGGEVVSTSKSCQVKVASSGNDYVANFLTVGNTTVDVSVTYNSSYGTVTSTSGTIATGSTLTPYLNEEVTLTAEPVTGYVFSGWTVTKGTESTNYSGTSLTFVATGEMSVQANFSTAIATYNISEATGTLENSTSSRYTTWSSSEVSGLYLTASYNSNAVEAISFNSGQVKLISAIYEDKTSTYKNPITYTLSAPDGYVITAYSMTYKSSSSNFAMTVANAQMTQTLANRNEVLTLSATGLSAQNTEFTVNGANTNYAIQVQEFTVTLQSEGGAIPTPTQYTITATANPGTAGSVTGGGTFTEGATVTLTATPNSGYEFVNWTKGGIEVSTNATYSFTANASASYVANFQTAAATTFAVTTTANPAAGGTATFAVGTNPATTSATVASGTGVTLYAVANDGYRFVNWTKGGMEVSTNATHNVTITEASNFVANFEEEAAATEYPTPTGATYENNYLTSVTTTGGDTNIDYSANAHPGQKLVVVPGKVQLAKGESFTMNLVAYSLGAGSISVTREDMRYCHASLFTDFDQDFTFEASPVQTWGNKLPTHNVYGNYDYVMNITHTITVPDDAPTGESHVRMIYTNAWKGWPANGTAELDKGIVYDIVVEVVEKIDITANANVGGTVTINGEATGTKRVIKGSEVTVNAIPAEGYKFANWSDTNDNIVSETAEYTFTANENIELQANFNVSLNINVELNDFQGNNYNAQLNDLPNVEIATIQAALLAKYPFITFNYTGSYDANSKCYTNTVELPFKVSNNSNTYWHNIYWPSNTNANPVYMSAKNATDTHVSKVTENEPYGSSSYNTYNNNDKISWAIYSVNESFEFIFKNELTGKYIQVTGVANSNAQNCAFVDEANATAFTLVKDAGSYNGDYSITAIINDTQGYLCSTQAIGYDYTTFYDGNGHQGAWVKFEEAEYLSKIMDVKGLLNHHFGPGEDKRIITAEIQSIIDALGTYIEDAGDINLTTLMEYANTIITTAKDDSGWHSLTLAVAPEESGNVTIADESVKSKKIPNNYSITINAIPAEGYEFVNWTNGTEPVSIDAEYTFTVTGATNLTANFQKKSYTVNVATGDTNGTAHIGDNAEITSTTVEHGNEVTLTAVPNPGYEFANWTNNLNTDVVTDNPYTFTVTEAVNYVANFKEATDIVTNYTVTLTTTGIDNSKFAVYINTGATQDETTKSYAAGSLVKVVAVPDNESVGSKGYVFVGWYNGEVCVSTATEYKFEINENITLEARFEKGCRVSVKTTTAYVTIYDSKGNEGTGTLLVKSGEVVRLTAEPFDEGYRIIWKDNSENIVHRGTEFTRIVTEDITLTAIAEAAFYTLTVSTEDTNGTVQAQSGTMDPGTAIEVGYNMTATITATPASGYIFDRWTKNEEFVSDDATYTVPAINDVDAMVDVEYVAHFVEAPEAEAGTYYRIAYDFPVTNAVATVAAGETLEYVISPSTGTPNNKGDFSNYWESDKSPVLRMESNTSTGVGIEKINTMSDGKKHSLVDGTDAGVVFTVYAPDGYKITDYSITGTTYGNITLNNCEFADNVSVSLSESKINVSSFSFTIKGGKNNSYNTGIDINSFTVTIQSEAAAEPETVRYYMQSETCGVPQKTNALLMNENTGASSIFYYAGNKLLSYSKGTYVKEDSNTRGLQGVGVAGGDVTIVSNGETSTIAAPNYMHANINEGTSKTYFVDHCSSDNGDAQHNFIVEEVTALPVTISAAGQATFYAPVALEIPDDLNVYVLKEKNISTESYATMTRLSRIIPANTGVIIKGTQGDYNFNIVEEDDNAIAEAIAEAKAEAEGNVFEGTVAATYVNKDAYILAKKNGVVGLFPLSNNSYITGGETATFNNKSHKAYLPVEGNFGELLKKSNGFRFIFDDSIATGIDEMKTENGNEKTIYDLQGRKLSEITEPGIYIINGKKVFVK